MWAACLRALSCGSQHSPAVDSPSTAQHKVEQQGTPKHAAPTDSLAKVSYPLDQSSDEFYPPSGLSGLTIPTDRTSINGKVNSSKARRKSDSLQLSLGLEHCSFIQDVTTPHARFQTESRFQRDSRSISQSRLSPGIDAAAPPGHIAEAQLAPASQVPSSFPVSEDNEDMVLLAVSTSLPEAMRRARWSSEDYTVDQQLYCGHSSVVYKATCSVSGETVAVKIYNLSEMPELNRLHLFREIKLHSRLSHPHIINCYAAFKEDQHVFIIQELAGGGDLLHLLYKYGGRIPESVVVESIAPPLLSAVQYMHSQGILHRDLKPENVLLTSTGIPKVADLGLAIDLAEERPNSQAGTLNYMAPEVLNCPLKSHLAENKQNHASPGYGMAADAWALGAVLYELIVGCAPFKGATEQETTHLVKEGELQFPKKLSAVACDFLSLAMAKNPLDRLTVAELRQHALVQAVHPTPLNLNFDEELLYGTAPYAYPEGLEGMEDEYNEEGLELEANRAESIEEDRVETKVEGVA